MMKRIDTQKRITLKDIAEMVGVSKVTVSRILSGKSNDYIKIRDETREAVLSIARKYNYMPQHSALSLATQRTGHIGFILSDSIAEGWSNVYFAKGLAGVEQACRERGYGLNISLYNLSNIDSFVFPKRVRQRSVDGLVLTGYVEAAVVHRFKEFGIPCVCIGDNLEVAELIPTVSGDVVGGLFQAVKYLAGLGHRKILFDSGVHRRDRQVGELLIERTKNAAETKECSVMLPEIPQSGGSYDAAEPLIEYWLGICASERPTAIIANDQILLAFLRELRKRNLNCPDDVSLISTCDTHLCVFSDPPLSSMRQDLKLLGHFAANMLIDHLDKGTPLVAKMSKDDFPCELIVRESCREP